MFPILLMLENQEINVNSKLELFLWINQQYPDNSGYVIRPYTLGGSTIKIYGSKLNKIIPCELAYNHNGEAILSRKEHEEAIWG